MGERREHPSRRTTRNSTTSGARGNRGTGSGGSSSSRTRAPRKGSARPTNRAAASTARSTGLKINKSKTSKPKINKPKSSKPKTSRSSKTKRPLRIPLGSASRRVRIIGIVMAITVSVCGGRLLQLQGFDSAAYGAIAAANLTTTTPLLPARGEITGRDGTVLAGTEPAVNITADPTLTAQPCGDGSSGYSGPLCGLNEATKIAQIIGAHTKIDLKQTIKTLTTTKQANGKELRFAYVKKKVPADVYTDIANELNQLRLPGIYRESNPIRTYPAGSVASNIVGFVNSENQGQAGIEYSMNKQLAGTEGSESYESAPNGSKIPLGQSTVTPAKNGTNYQLTIDPSLQWTAQRRLDAQVAKTGADDGMAVTINVKTGEVLAMAQSPGFDSSDPGASKSEDLADRPISEAYEPGSVEKVLTAAALLDSGTATPETRVRVPGTIRSGDGRIKDDWSHGVIRYRLRGIIANSSNIGTLMMARQMDKATLHDYLAKFGLGKTTGVELPGSQTGYLPPANMKDYTRDQIAFGQGISVTALQEAAAVAGIVNGGVYHQPTVIKSETKADGTKIPVNHPAGKRVISTKASAGVRDMMQAVVTHNEISQKMLMLDNYSSGGKTGTAQRYDPDCGCYKGYVTSFIGFAPLNDPQILTYVVINNPKRGDTGTGTAGPVYRDLMDYALPRYGITPDQKNKKAGAAAMDRPLTW